MYIVGRTVTAGCELVWIIGGTWFGGYRADGGRRGQPDQRRFAGKCLQITVEIGPFNLVKSQPERRAITSRRDSLSVLRGQTAVVRASPKCRHCERRRSTGSARRARTVLAPGASGGPRARRGSGYIIHQIQTSSQSAHRLSL